MNKTPVQKNQPSNEPTLRPSWLAKRSLFFFDKAKTTFGLWFVLAMAGVFSYTTLLPREGFPPIQIPFGYATGTLLVNDSAQVDERVTLPVAELLAEVDGIQSVSTSADDNFFVISAQFDEDITSQAGTEKMQQEIERAGILPEEAQIEYTVLEPAKYLNKYDVIVSVYDRNGIDLRALEASARQVSSQLQETDAVSAAQVEGQFSEGVNPLTGQTVSQQASFDRIGIRNESGVLEFYPSVAIGITGADGYDVIALSKAVEQSASDIAGGAGEGVGVHISADFGPVIETQIGSLESNVLTGLLAVAVISFLLITWRASLVTGLFMVTVMLVTLFVLYLIGITLNTISLFALVLALGLFVDDATIVVEAIDAGRRQKKFRRQVVADAVSKVAGASFAGTMTTVLVFLPLVFVTGILGDFIRILPLTIIVALLTSLVLSLTLIPFLSRFVLFQKKDNDSNRFNPISAVESKLAYYLSRPPLLFRRSRTLGLLVSAALIGVSLLFFAGSGYFANQLKFNIFPPTKDADQLSVDIGYPEGTTITQAEQIAKDIEQIVETEIGDQVLQGTYGAYGAPTQRSANLYLALVPYTDRDVTAKQLIERIDRGLEQFDAATVRVSQIDVGPPTVEFPFQMQVYGENQSSTLRLAEDVRTFLQDSTVERPNGTTARITDVKIDNTRQVVRKDAVRFVQLSAAYNADDTSALVEATRGKIEQQFDASRLGDYGLQPEDVTFDFGQESQNQESFSSLILVGPVAVAAMFVLLAVQFRSLLQPLLIFMAIPFSFFGVMYGLNATSNPISFFTMIGFFGLIGIAVNNTILLTDYANQERRAGKDLITAISEATRKRFRPLITTSLTTVAALVPLALTDPFWEPLAITIIFGLLSSTFLVVVSFPYYYLMAEYLRARVSRTRMLIWMALLVGFVFATINLGGTVLLGISLFVSITVVAAVVLKRRSLRAV